MPTPDTSILVTPGTTGTVAFERVGPLLYQTVMATDGYGRIIGNRDTYVASDRRTVATTNAWYITLMNDTTTTFVEVSKVCISASTSSAPSIQGKPRIVNLFRISAKNGGANATFSEYDTASPGPTLARIKAARRPTSATTSGPPLASITLNTGEGSLGNVTGILFNSTEDPILLRGQQGIGIQQDGTVVTGLVSSYIVFRVRS